MRLTIDMSALTVTFSGRSGGDMELSGRWAVLFTLFAWGRVHCPKDYITVERIAGLAAWGNIEPGTIGNQIRRKQREIDQGSNCSLESPPDKDTKAWRLAKSVKSIKLEPTAEAAWAALDAGWLTGPHGQREDVDQLLPALEHLVRAHLAVPVNQIGEAKECTAPAET